MTIVPLPYLIHQSKSQVSHDWIGLLFNLSSVRAARNDCVAEERRRRHHPPALPRLRAAAPGEPRPPSICLPWSFSASCLDCDSGPLQNYMSQGNKFICS